MMRLVSVAILALAIAAGNATAQVTEVIGEVRVHGNHTTPDADVLAIAALTVGAAVTDAVLGEAAERLRRSGRFDGVEVRKRYRSIDDPSDILVIVLIDEVAGITADDLTPGPWKRMRSFGMWLPVIDYEDGYGFTYGARVSFVDVFGKRSRVSVPLTWGGERQVAAEVDRTFERGPFTRVEGAASLSRRENPHYDIGDTRQELRGRAERALTSWLRVGGGVRLTNVSFGEIDDTFVAPGADIVLDTRTDPAFPRNAVHATAGIEQLDFDSSTSVTRWTSEVRGYVGLFGSTVLALRGTSVQSSDPLPGYEQALVGGMSSLRGFDLGYRAGDNLAAASAELRMPLTSPLTMGRFGVKAFIDAGTVYSSGAKLSEQRFDRGAGGGVFLTWTVLRMSLDVAWPITGTEKSANVHFGLGVTF
jgi:outer membrane protein assembly factor BamA